MKAFRDGRVAAEFTGALPPAEVERFFDALVPSEADELAAERGRGGPPPRARARPEPPDARRELGRLLLARGDTDEASRCSRARAGDFVADGLLARAELAGRAICRAARRRFEAWDRGDHARGARGASGAPSQRESDPERRDLIRRVMVAHLHRAGAGRPARARAPAPAVRGAELS